MTERFLPRRQWVRWLLVPLATLGSCTAIALLGGGAEELLRATADADWIEGTLSLDARWAIGYGAAAYAFVVGGSVMAPRWRGVVSLALFACGAVVAQWWLGSWYFPEFHPRAYEHSALPLEGCLAGGILGVLTVWWFAAARLRLHD